MNKFNNLCLLHALVILEAYAQCYLRYNDINDFDHLCIRVYVKYLEKIV